jgi:hypothetical protein
MPETDIGQTVQWINITSLCLIPLHHHVLFCCWLAQQWLEQWAYSDPGQLTALHGLLVNCGPILYKG